MKLEKSRFILLSKFHHDSKIDTKIDTKINERLLWTTTVQMVEWILYAKSHTIRKTEYA